MSGVALRSGSAPALTSPAGRAPGLADLQELFQRAVMTGDDAILAEICDNSRTTRDVLLGVYRHAYTARLIDILAGGYELLFAYLGRDAFEAAAHRYIACHPSQTPNARWFGEHFPAFLAEEALCRGRREIVDLAKLEFALGVAFDAADAPVLGLQELAAVKPEEWGGLVFQAHPSAHLVACTTDAMALWMALKDNEVPPAALALDGEEVQYILVWREGARPMLRVAGREEAMMWQEAVRGQTFAALCEMLATFAEPENAAVRAAQYLYGWMTAGMLSRAVHPSDD